MNGDPLARFEAEHREALAELNRLERCATALREGKAEEPEFAAMQEIHRFLSGPVRVHNENEERALFPRLGLDAPTAIFQEEHLRLRVLERALENSIARRDRSASADAALELVALLRVHIEREDQVLFPLAREILGPDGLREVAQCL